MNYWVLIAFILFLLAGVPVSFAMLFSSLIYILSIGLPLSSMLQFTVSGVYSFTLLAVPFFVMAGAFMNRGGITNKLFKFADTAIGHIPGGMGHANVLASIMFAGMSGSAVADAGGLGAVEIKCMKEAGYDIDFSVAVTGASACIGPIIPPSILAVIYCSYSGASPGRVFVAGIIPGLLMGAGLCVAIAFHCIKHKYPLRKRASFSELWRTFLDAFPSLLTPIILIGGITSGIFTPTEGSAVACLYALILCLVTKQMGFSDFMGVLKESLVTTCNVGWLIACSNMFAWVLTRMGISSLIISVFQNMTASPAVAIFILIVMLLIIGTVLDNAAAVAIFAPTMVKIAGTYGIGPERFGIIMMVTLVIGLLTPPVGMVLFTLSSLTKLSVMRIAKATMPYILALIVVVLFVAYIPALTDFLPNLMYGA